MKRSRNKNPSLWKFLLLRSIQRILFYFSKEARKIRRKNRKIRWDLFIHRLNIKISRIKYYFSKRGRYFRRKRRKEYFRYVSFRFNIFINRIRYWNSKEIRQLRRQKRKRAWQFFFEKRRFFMELYIFRIFKTFMNTKKWLAQENNRKEFIINSVNSTIIFILSYFFTYLLYQLATSAMAKLYNIPSVIYYFKTDFLIRPYSNLWTRDNIILISFIGPFISLISGFLFFRIFHFFKKRPGLLKLFFLWCTLHAFNMFFGAYIAGVITNKGFGLVTLWLFFQLLLNISFAFICVVFLVLIGSNVTKPFLQTAHHSSLISENNRVYFLSAQALIPYIVGNIFIFFLSFPEVKPYQSFLLVSLGFLIVPIILKPNFDKLKIVKEYTPLQIDKKSVIIFIILVLLFRIGLDYGIKL